MLMQRASVRARSRRTSSLQGAQHHTLKVAEEHRKGKSAGVSDRRNSETDGNRDRRNGNRGDRRPEAVLSQAQDQLTGDANKDVDVAGVLAAAAAQLHKGDHAAVQGLIDSLAALLADAPPYAPAAICAGDRSRVADTCV
ncbi:hypothetical protein ACWEOE_01540 [Amycolatopsis sp. NPDC004368]